MLVIWHIENILEFEGIHPPFIKGLYMDNATPFRVCFESSYTTNGYVLNWCVGVECFMLVAYM